MKPKVSFYNEENVFIVNDESEECMIMMCVKAGCGREPSGQNGIAHLVEHICLAYRHQIPTYNDEYLSFRKAGFRFSGYTNYEQTYLKFSFPSHIENIIKFLQLLESIITSSIVCEEIFELSKKEILSECVEKASQWNWQQELISFITEYQIEHIPVGRTNEIESLQLHDASSYIQNCYTKDNFALIFFTSVPLNEIMPKISPLLQRMSESSVKPTGTMPTVKKSETNEPSVCLLKHPSDQIITEIYFQNSYRPLNLKGKLTRMLFEILFINIIEEYMDASRFYQKYSNVSVSDKHVTSDFYYAVLTFHFTSKDNTLPHFTKELVEYLKKKVISEDHLSESKKIIAPFLNSSEFASREELLQNLTAHFFYGEPIHVTDEHYKMIAEILDQIDIIDIVQYSKWVLEAPCKIVIST